MRIVTIIVVLVGASDMLSARELTLEVRNGAGVVSVGALRRWDQDGNPRKAVDPKAKIDQPDVVAWARRQGDDWVFGNLESGRYDLVIFAKNRIRVEGFQYPPVREFDPFFPAVGKDPEEDNRDRVLKDIAKGRHYENKVTPLHVAGDATTIRVLMQLVRDQPTSYDDEVGYPVATVRHEVWQYTFRYGAWTKEKATRVLDRLLLPRKQLSQWTWIWEPRLGGIDIGTAPPERIVYEMPKHFNPKTARGWFGE